MLAFDIADKAAVSSLPARRRQSVTRLNAARGLAD